MDSDEHISLDYQRSYDLFRKQLPPDGFAGLKRLKSLIIAHCETEECLANAPATTIVFPVLEELDFFGLRNLRQICRGPAPEGSFGKLTSIEIRDCDSLEYLFPLQIVGCLTQLERLTIKSCRNMKEVIWKEQGDAHIATNGIKFRKLEFLHLGYLTKLVGFCTGIDEIDFPKLRCMHLEYFSKRLFDIKSSLPSNSEQNFDVGKQIFDSPNASSIFPQKVTFPYLEDLSLEGLRGKGYSELQISPFLTVKKLVVSNCYNLRYVFNSSMARHLVHLKELNISNCSEMHAVVDWEEEIEDTTLFPQLSKLQLNDLSNLRRLCRGPVPGGSFGELTSVEISDCKRLEYLFPLQIVGCLTQLERLTIQSCYRMKEVIWKEQGDAHIATNGIEFRNLEFLDLQSLPSLVGFCTGIDQIDFPKLKCMCLRNFQHFKRLFDIKSSRSSNSDQNFDVGSLSLFPQKVTFPCLEDLSLHQLHYSELQISPFLTVKKLVVNLCYNLRYVFNSSMARHLVHLEELNISNCSKMDAVVDWEEEIEDGQERKVDITLLPQLSKLQLINLPRLRKLCRGPIPGGSFGELTSDQNFDVGSLYLFPQKVTFPCLEDLILQGLGNWGDKYFTELLIRSFPTVKKLEVSHCGSLRYVFNSSMARHLVHLKELNISNCSKMHALVDWEEEIEDRQERKVDTTLFPQLRKLQLNDLVNLRRLCRGPVPGGFFGELTSVEIMHCNNLENLFQLQMVGCLTQLERLIIQSCTNMKEVIWKEQGDTLNTLFPQLLKLQLNDLLNLKRFCHFTHTSELPMLSELDIRGCPTMEEFSLGHVSTPNLSLSGISWNGVLNPDISWNGDLNNALRLLQKLPKKRRKAERDAGETDRRLLVSDEREKPEREKAERERLAGVEVLEEGLQGRRRVADEDIHEHSLDSDEGKPHLMRSIQASEINEPAPNIEDENFKDGNIHEHLEDSDEGEPHLIRSIQASEINEPALNIEYENNRDDDIHEHWEDADKGEPRLLPLVQASEINEPTLDIEYENDGDDDIHEHWEDLDEMDLDSYDYETDGSIERNNSTITWRETLPPNPQRGRCICFRTADLYTGKRVITRFYSVPFDFFGGGDDDDSSNPDVEGLKWFYECTDFATTSRLSSVGSSLFVVGGSEETGPCRVSITTKKMYRFDTTAPENGWNSYELSMCTPRAFPITVTMDGKLYILGGSGPESPDAPLAEMFNPESSTFESLPRPPSFHIDGWRHLVVAALQPSKKILVASGLSDVVSLYNVVKGVWEESDHKIDFSSVRGQAAVVQNGNALCWCSNNVEEVHAYHLVHKKWFKSPIKGLDKVSNGPTHYCPIFPLDDNHLCLLWKDQMGYDGTNLPLLHCIKIRVSMAPRRSRFDAVVVASRTYVLGPHESIFDAHVFLREDDEGGERGSGLGGPDNGGSTWKRSGYGGGRQIVSSIPPCSKCWGTGHTESSCDQVGSGGDRYG